MLFYFYKLFIMKKQLEKLKIFLEEDDFNAIDLILTDIYATWAYTQEEIDEYDDILKEITLYTELKEKEYKDEALRMIGE